MSQYPSPYSVPQPYPVGAGYDPFGAYLGPARRAGVMMIVLGSLMALFGSCFSVILLAPRQMLEQQVNALNQSSPEKMTANELRQTAGIQGISMFVLGVPMLILGVPVRRNGATAITAGIVLTLLVFARSGVLLILDAVQRPNAAQLVVGGCASLIWLAAFIVQLVWLIQASRARSQIEAMQSQYQQQYWQFQQQQQMYAQQAGYPQPPPPPPPNQPPPNT